MRGKNFIFYEGPPYANGKPALHHILARIVKDIILRYKTMQGYNVPRRAGWDTHGLPVEMAAEKALGFKSKKDIEAYGVEKFNEKAKEQVWIHKDEWERLTEADRLLARSQKRLRHLCAGIYRNDLVDASRRSAKETFI